MSELTPSFHTLYGQARPPHQRGPKLMEQRERFATACLAFALQHDPIFRVAFLKTICDYEPKEEQKFEVSLEIKSHLNNKRWDLALSVKEEAVFVVEVKIDAPLDDVQNPDVEGFFTSGYGGGIVKSYPAHKTRIYIVLWQKEESLISHGSSELRCIAKHWKMLDKIRESNPVSSLVDDLLKSLGSFNIRCFSISNPMTDELKLANHAEGACKVHAVLADVVSYLKHYIGLPHVKDSSAFEVDVSYIGWDITRKKADPKWIDFIAPEVGKHDDEISWFGYHGNGKLNVGFYCEPNKVKNVESTLKKLAGESEKVCKDKNYVWIESEGSVVGDKEWFKVIYDRLSDHIKLDRRSLR